jgi:hypothetical protein
MKTIYECPQSKGVKWSTIICFIVVFAGLIYEIYLFTETGHSVEAVVITSILLLVVFSSFLVFPLYIISDDEGIGIKTLLRTKRIAFQDIDHIERMEKSDWFFGIRKGAFRIFGVGGVFGFIGLFRLKGIGNFWSYVTDERKAFIIYRKKGLPVAISVSEPDDFLPFYLKGGSK